MTGAQLTDLISIENYCQTVGCVCSESTRGPNFVTGLEKARECAKRKCFSGKDVQAAEMAFQDVCLVYAAGSTRPSTSGRQPSLFTLPESLTFYF
ncbi:hypothetical protein GQ44DRAFT_711226 [Phaeosphaeriaceae sp. PMI808]|nr:hypothetical protein GQ44DRAFT_711226 [Phaeosphaeriaceae sp. PMI808]